MVDTLYIASVEGIFQYMEVTRNGDVAIWQQPVERGQKFEKFRFSLSFRFQSFVILQQVLHFSEKYFIFLSICHMPRVKIFWRSFPKIYLAVQSIDKLLKKFQSFHLLHVTKRQNIICHREICIAKPQRTSIFCIKGKIHFFKYLTLFGGLLPNDNIASSSTVPTCFFRK